MTATFQPPDPVPQLLDELVDALHLLYECRRRGVVDLERLIEYIEYTMDEIERQLLGMSSELFLTLIDPDRADGIAWNEAAMC